MLLKTDQLNDNVKKALAVMFCANLAANTTIKDRLNAIVNDTAEDKKNIVDVKNYVDANVTHS